MYSNNNFTSSIYGTTVLDGQFKAVGGSTIGSWEVSFLGFTPKTEPGNRAKLNISASSYGCPHNVER